MDERFKLPSRFEADDLVDCDILTQGVPCSTEWCNARTNPKAPCGDHGGPYVLDHANRVRRARARELRAERAARRAGNAQALSTPLLPE